MSGATLFRRNGPAWRFTWEPSCQMYVHRTRRGTLYAIAGVTECKPMWIGRMHDKSMFTAEQAIGAEYIQFDNGDEYWFGGKPK